MNISLPTIPELLKTKEEKKVETSYFEFDENVESDTLEMTPLETYDLDEITKEFISVEAPHTSAPISTPAIEGLDWQHVLQSSLQNELALHSPQQQQWGQLVDMLMANAPETSWSCCWIGNQTLSNSLIAYAYHFLIELVLSPDWHSPKNAQVQFGKWNGLPTLKISWEKSDHPPSFINENDDIEVFVEYRSGKEVITFLEIHYFSDERKEV
jgi:hypothetical protein